MPPQGAVALERYGSLCAHLLRSWREMPPARVNLADVARMRTLCVQGFRATVHSVHSDGGLGGVLAEDFTTFVAGCTLAQDHVVLVYVFLAKFAEPGERIAEWETPVLRLVQRALENCLRLFLPLRSLCGAGLDLHQAMDAAAVEWAQGAQHSENAVFSYIGYHYCGWHYVLLALHRHRVLNMIRRMQLERSLEENQN